MKDGVISECGTYKELIRSQGDFADFLINYFNEEGDEHDIDEETLEEITNMKHFAERRMSRDSLNEILMRKRTISQNSTKSQKSLKDDEKNINKAKLTEEEQSETGSVKWSVYLEYMKKVGISSWIITLVCMVIMGGFNIGASMWLSQWSEDSNDEQSKNNTGSGLRNLRVGIYAALGVDEATFSFALTIVISISTLLGRITHDFQNLLKFPIPS